MASFRPLHDCVSRGIGLAERARTPLRRIPKKPPFSVNLLMVNLASFAESPWSFNSTIEVYKGFFFGWPLNEKLIW